MQRIAQDRMPAQVRNLPSQGTELTLAIAPRPGAQREGPGGLVVSVVYRGL